MCFSVPSIPAAQSNGTEAGHGDLATLVPCTSPAPPVGSAIERLPPGHVFAGLQRNGYRCLVIDPPTRFVAGTKGRPQHYDRMTDADIAALPVADLLHPEGAWIFLWVTSPKLYAPAGSRSQLSPDAVARAWGARYSGRAFVWVKTKASATGPTIHREHDLHVGMGFTTRKNAEDCLLFRTGMPQRWARDVREVIVSSVREHSRKPDEAMARIERFCPGPRVELFAREVREGWDTWGDEVGMFKQTLSAAAIQLSPLAAMGPANGQFFGPEMMLTASQKSN